MNERVKEIRTKYGLKQSEFAKRLGVTGEQISRIEGGKRHLTDQMVLAICREFGISEAWLRTGEGEAHITAENALIAQISDQYGLDALDRKILEIYVELPESHKKAFKDFALRLAGAAVETSFGAEFAEELAATEELEAEKQHKEFNRDLTEDEAVELYRQRLRNAKKGMVSSTTYEKYAFGKTNTL